MLGKKLLAACLSLIFAFGSSVTVIAETPESSEIPSAAEETDEPAVEEKPAAEAPEAPEPQLLGEADLRILGGELEATGRRLRRAYNSYSIVPGTWRWMEEEIDKGNALAAALAGIIILPIDFAISRLYGNFVGSYHLGRAGDHLIAGSKVFPAEQAVLMEKSGNNLKTSRTYGLFSNALFYGGFSTALVSYYRTLAEEDETSSSSLTYAGLGAMAAGYALRLLSVHYAGSAGSRLGEISASPLSNEPLKAMGEAGEKLQDYEKYTYWGYGLTALGIGIAVAGKDDDTLLTTGVLTTLAGWIVSSPVAVNSIKSAANKLQEVSDRMMYWKE